VLEKKLTEADEFASSAEKTGREYTSSLGRIRKALAVGDMLVVRRVLAEIQGRLSTLESQHAELINALTFDEAAYLVSPAYLDELVEAASAVGVRTVRTENGIQSFPISVIVQGRRTCVLLGKRRETRLRPSIVAQELLRLRNSASEMDERTFIEVLYSAYRVLAPQENSYPSGAGGVVPLMQVHSMLTLLPRVAKDYSIQEFAVDIYRLDRSGVQHTSDGSAIALPASTGTRNSSGILSVVAESGEEVRYYGVSFVRKQNVGGLSDAAMA
jgi:hypothetical protein